MLKVVIRIYYILDHERAFVNSLDDVPLGGNLLRSWTEVFKSLQMVNDFVNFVFHLFSMPIFFRLTVLLK